MPSIEECIKEFEQKNNVNVVHWEHQGRGNLCPHCGSVNLEHDNKYPRFETENGKISKCVMQTKCLNCGTLFDKPKYAEVPYLVFKDKDRKSIGFIEMPV